MGAGVVALEGDGGQRGGTFVSAIRFGDPINDPADVIEDRDEVRSTTNGVMVGHAGWAGVEIEPANGCSGMVVFNWLYPRLCFRGVLSCGNPGSDQAVVVAQCQGVCRLSERSRRVGRIECGDRQLCERFGVG